MQNGMLGDNEVLREFWNGPLLTLLERVNGSEGEAELEAFKRYLRKEDPWPKPNYADLIKEIRVDLDADPFIPKSWTVKEHRKGGIVTISQEAGRLYLDGEPLELYVSEDQVDKEEPVRLPGEKLWEQLKEKRVLNANLLDALIKPQHQHLIPRDWMSQPPAFWGTVYINKERELMVRCLKWLERRSWSWRRGYLRYSWSDWSFRVCPALLDTRLPFH